MIEPAEFDSKSFLESIDELKTTLEPFASCSDDLQLQELKEAVLLGFTALANFKLFSEYSQRLIENISENVDAAIRCFEKISPKSGGSTLPILGPRRDATYRNSENHGVRGKDFNSLSKTKYVGNKDFDGHSQEEKHEILKKLKEDVKKLSDSSTDAQLAALAAALAAKKAQEKIIEAHRKAEEDEKRRQEEEERRRREEEERRRREEEERRRREEEERRRREEEERRRREEEEKRRREEEERRRREEEEKRRREEEERRRREEEERRRREEEDKRKAKEEEERKAKEEEERKAKEEEERKAKEEEERKAKEEEERKAKEEEERKAKEEEERKAKEEEERKAKEEEERKAREEEERKAKEEEERKAKAREMADGTKWPAYKYEVSPGKTDQGIVCLVWGEAPEFTQDMLECRAVPQVATNFVLDNNQQLLSNIVRLTPTHPDRLLQKPIHVAIPFYAPRPPLGREAVMVAETDNGQWTALDTKEVTFSCYKARSQR
ncbi:hypothetical protein NP493_62g00016 [Ridgeia piscesae]|uniref:Uncharacterized protein n=1 Tax=Ridgeia piscesae TaxID=27915 RepID=A0AAD9PAE3_RIDPI|nr:hypothetical protein NP493_62g00016 [Ridgeia piscesae]